MTKKTVLALAAAVAAFVGAQASAQTLYRCGADGREFSEKPCQDGKRMDVNAASPSAADAAAARDAAKRDARLADQLHRENEARGRQQAVANAGAIHGIPAAAPASAASKPQGKKKKAAHKKAGEEKFTALQPRAAGSQKP